MNTEKLSAIIGLNVIIDVVSILLENIGRCEEEVYTFLANISNLSVNDIKELPLDTFAQMIIDVLEKKELSSFFGVVFKLLK